MIAVTKSKHGLQWIGRNTWNDSKEKETLTFQYLRRQQRALASSPQGWPTGKSKETWDLGCSSFFWKFAEMVLSLGLSFLVFWEKITHLLFLPKKGLREENKQRPESPQAGADPCGEYLGDETSPMLGPGSVWSQWSEKAATGNRDQGRPSY